MKRRESTNTLVTLANAGELVSNIAAGVLGNDVADTFNGSPLTTSVVQNIAQTQFQNALSKYIGDK
jgi:hypothetical protein